MIAQNRSGSTSLTGSHRASAWNVGRAVKDHRRQSERCPALKPGMIDPGRLLCDDAHTQTIQTGGLMADTIIENPILNSPFRGPDRHWRFTDEIVETHRASAYFVSVPPPKKKGKQLQFDTEWTQDRIEPNDKVNRIPVSGPFTVESLSPDRIVSTDEERPASELVGQKHPGRADFATMILDNLRKSGVQNTFKNERLKFDRLEPHAGAWIHATGDYANGDGKTRRVAVTIGPEYGTVTPQQVKEAAKEAVSGIGFDILIVCGFAFDPHVSEEAKRYGKLTVLPARMNPDLLIGDTLKNTGAGNLFMIFGEPDIAITRDADGKLVVEVKGVDVYDPTTGQIRSSSTDDIACWFIDTDYNGECFFVRHAYFLGAEDPYAKLKRALRAEIDEAQWATLYSTKSYPFEPPKSGKIAVKVINHYGDEVLKVYQV